MRSNLLKFASALCLLAAVAFVAVGSAKAEGKFSGGAGVGFGMVKWDTGATGGQGTPASGTAYNAQIEANLIYSGTNENMDYYFRMRARGTSGDTIVKSESEGTFTDGQLQTVRARVGYTNGPFRMEIGRLPGIGGIGFADLRPVRAPSGFRHYVDNLGMFDSGAINLSFNAGVAKVGLAISTDCQADCSGGVPSGSVASSDFGLTGGAAVAVTSGSVNTGNKSTIMPYVQAKAGPMKLGLRYAMSSQDVAAVVKDDVYDCSVYPCTLTTSTTTTVDTKGKGKGFVVEAAFDGGQFGAALEYTSLTATCINPVGQTGCKDNKESGPGLAVTFGGGLFQYSKKTSDSGSTSLTYKKPTVTVISASYLFDVGGGQLGPEVASAKNTSSSTTGKDQTGTLFRLLAKTGF